MIPSEEAVALAKQKETEEEYKKREGKIQYMSRHTKDLFKIQKQEKVSQISIKDPNAEAQVLEGKVLGHPDILRKFNVAMKQDDLNKSCMVQKSHKGEIEGVSYELLEMAPEVFSIIRKIQNVSEELIS